MQCRIFPQRKGALTSQGLSYGSSNAIAGGKTPISSMSPTIVFKEGVPFMAIGSAGGPSENYYRRAARDSKCNRF
ncbi:gamma-glutamyltransferase [Treponema vincentii]|uniref:gamma-glutamyltransferase n=1 Tax=Treponema vincentii TaxID=69710 RepID=UPI001939C259